LEKFVVLDAESVEWFFVIVAEVVEHYGGEGVRGDGKDYSTGVKGGVGRRRDI
jgi:hypothetical protein